MSDRALGTPEEAMHLERPLSHPRPRAHPALALAALLLAAAAGCTGDLNTSNDLLDAEPFPALSPPPEEAVARDDAPSVSSLDRRNWPVAVVSVPRGQVEHQPTYVRTILPDESLPRDRGLAPRGGEVLDTTGDPLAEVVEAGANIPWTPAQLVVAPVEMAMGRWPWTTLRSQPDYERIAPRSVRDPWIWILPVGSAPVVPLAAPAPDEDPFGTSTLP